MTSSTPATSSSSRRPARSGDYLIVSFASAEVLWHHKRRKPSIPDDHKRALLQGLRMIDEVIVTQGHKEGLDFEEDFLRIRPDFLIVTEDDKYGDLKRELCAQVGAQYTVLPKTPPRFEPVSTSSIVRWVQAPTEAPLRVDFAGGWLDVPRFSRPGEFVVNCAISPLVSLREWPYEKQAGLGGSGAWALLNGRDGVESEIDLGVGWQDPAVIRETGLCVWRSGHQPVLDFKHNGDFLTGRMAIYWTGTPHDTPGRRQSPARLRPHRAKRPHRPRGRPACRHPAPGRRRGALSRHPARRRHGRRCRKSPAPSPANTAAAATAATRSICSTIPPTATPPSPPRRNSAPSNRSAGSNMRDG